MAPHSSTLACKTPWTEELSDFTLTFHFHALEKEMATHSSVLAWRIPGMGEPGGLLSIGVAQNQTRLKRLSSSSKQVFKISIDASWENCLQALGEPTRSGNTSWGTLWISWVRSGLEAGWRRVRDEEPLGEVGQSVERSLPLVSSLGNRGVKVLLT